MCLSCVLQNFVWESRIRFPITVARFSGCQALYAVSVEDTTCVLADENNNVRDSMLSSVQPSLRINASTLSCDLRMSLAHYFDHKSLVALAVKFGVEDALPQSQVESARRDGNDHLVVKQ